jgi:hypothetical protein
MKYGIIDADSLRFTKADMALFEIEPNTYYISTDEKGNVYINAKTVPNKNKTILTIKEKLMSIEEYLKLSKERYYNGF